jgi:hypothetical protein
LQFIFPFFAMLSARIRCGPYSLLVIASGTLALRFVESCLLVLPGADARGEIMWLAIPAAIGAAIGLVGLSLQLSLALLQRSAHDRRQLAEATST